jgi:AcrR family transcriptional regulator
MDTTRVKHKPSAVGAESGAGERIIKAARSQFFAHGFRGVTMDELARDLGMSKKTLYACFPSKSVLLRAVLLDKFSNVEEDLSRITSAAPGGVLAALQQLLACMQRHAEEIQPPFVRDIRREAPEMFQLVQSRRRELIQRHFASVFEAGRHAGIIRKDVSTRLMIEVLLGATEAIMNPAKMAELELTPKAGFVSITTVILQGILTDKGRSR